MYGISNNAFVSLEIPNSSAAFQIPQVGSKNKVARIKNFIDCFFPTENQRIQKSAG